MRALRPLVLFGIGGLAYVLIELLWRGYSHWSMFIVGGMCFILIGGINEYYLWDMPLWKQMLISAVIVTVIEFVAGLILNIWLKLGVWDYYGLPFNFMGQICLYFSVVWFFLAFPAIVIDDYLRHWLFGEEFPKYKIL